MSQTIDGVTDLIPSISIAALLARRDNLVGRMRTLAMLSDEAKEAGGFGMAIPRLEYSDAGAGAQLLSLRHMDAITKGIDAGGWEYLMKQSGLWSLMDAQARREWQNKIMNRQVPALTEENIAATFGALHESRGDIFERGVLNAFRALSWDYKTNSPVRFGKRIIVNYLVEVRGRLAFFQRDACNSIDDLVRLFHLLDGKPAPDHRTGGTLVRLTEAERSPGTALVDAYIEIKWFKKGTGHVLFRRADLVDRLNAILAKHHPNALPAPH